jgi:DNA-binding response OmpR family regulator
MQAANRRPAAVPARRILAVEDNRDTADSLALLLRLKGNEVYTAYDGAAALEAGRQTVLDRTRRL